VYADPRSNSECVPLNPFQTDLPDEVVDYITGGATYHDQKLRQDVIDITLQTDIGEDRRQGPISIGGGFSYRDEWMYQDAWGTAEDPRRHHQWGVFSSFNEPTDMIPIRGIPAFVRDRGVYTTGNPNGRGPLTGEFDVWEVYSEAIVPLARYDAGGVDLHAAARYADYEGSGGVWAGKVGLDWQLNEPVRFRATWSRDTRAGTLSERFDTQGGGFNLQAGMDPLKPDEAYIPGLTTGGNPEIRPELSDTVTMGVVYQPTWAGDLSFSFDVYDIRIKDAIDQLGAEELLNRCYFQGATELCDLIIRNDEGYIRSIFNLYINIAETVTKGVDMEAIWRRDMRIFGGDESISLRFFGNYLDEVSNAFAGAIAVNEAGQMEYPKWLTSATFGYTNGPFTLSWQTRYRDKTRRDFLWVEGIDIADNSVSSRTYTNVNVSYDFELGSTTAQAYFYIGNLFDEDPPMVAAGIGGTSGRANYTNNAYFDTLGRQYNLGVSFQF
jgi:outer membrane receptor protein involved in Fe transport